jgi:hypothetical protein
MACKPSENEQQFAFMRIKKAHGYGKRNHAPALPPIEKRQRSARDG